MNKGKRYNNILEQIDRDKNYSVEKNKLVYLNRLSDLMFVIARSINQSKGVEESLWKQS